MGWGCLGRCICQVGVGWKRVVVCWACKRYPTLSQSARKVGAPGSVVGLGFSLFGCYAGCFAVEEGGFLG